MPYAHVSELASHAVFSRPFFPRNALTMCGLPTGGCAGPILVQGSLSAAEITREVGINGIRCDVCRHMWDVFHDKPLENWLVARHRRRTKK